MLAGACYYGLALIAAVRRLLERPTEGSPEEAPMPPVSVLKPVHGRDPNFYEAIRSHAEQDYPEFEILFGVSDPRDAAIADIERLRRAYPRRSIRLITALNDAPNGKAGVLAKLAGEACYGILLVNDSDIFVEPGYLRAVISDAAEARVGVVTCLYRAASEHWPGRFEALGIATDFAAGVLAARMLGIAEFALGSTMAFRVEHLRAIGGFEALTDFLADDYQLGRRITALGYRVAMASPVVETHLSGASWSEVWRHQVRWSRTIRVSRPGGYYGYLVTQVSFWAAIALLAGQWQAAAAAVALRILAGALVAGPVLRMKNTLAWAPLIPLRDLWGFAVWCAGLTGKTVEWRGERLLLSADGKIHKYAE